MCGKVNEPTDRATCPGSFLAAGKIQQNQKNKRNGKRKIAIAHRAIRVDNFFAGEERSIIA